MANGHLDRAKTFFLKQQWREAERELRLALSANEGNAAINLGNLAMTLQFQRRWAEAAQCFSAVLREMPQHAPAASGLGLALLEGGNPGAAIAALQHALSIRPHFVDDWLHLSLAAGAVLRQDLAVQAARRAAELDTAKSIDIRSNVISWQMNAHGDDGPALRMATESLCESRGIKRLRMPAVEGRKIRIGYVSPDFSEHAVARFLLSFLPFHDREKFEIFLYSNVESPDTTTQRFKDLGLNWREILQLKDEAAAELIARDEIDVLIDLAGHTIGNRLGIFALRPAPVQVTYLGSPGTTGMPEMDFRLTDSISDPPGMTESHYTEKLVRIDPCFICFDPPAIESIDVNRASQSITFASFNAVRKISPKTLSLWSRVLREVPNSNLMIKAAALEYSESRHLALEVFTKADIDPARVKLLPRTATYADHLRVYEQVTIALDTYPYNGTTTTCESLWMGVPVVTLRGPTHMSRVGTSILTNIGLPKLIASSDDEYVRLATELSRDTNRLQSLRTNLRQRVKDSPLVDGRRFALNIESAFRECLQMAAFL